MAERRPTDHIRSIFLHDEARVTVATAAELLGWTAEQMRAAVDSGEIETIRTPCGRMVDRREVAEAALHLSPLTIIEQVVGEEVSLVVPAAVRTPVLRAVAALRDRGSTLRRKTQNPPRRSSRASCRHG